MKKNVKIGAMVAVALVALIGFILINNRTQEAPEHYDIEEVEIPTFNPVVIARCYLDGNEGLTYQESYNSIVPKWVPFVLEALDPTVELSEQQLAVVTLAAMRMGKTAFLRSTFLQKVNKGNLEEATDWLLLQKKNGSIRPLGKEATQYFYMLKVLWSTELNIDYLAVLPMFSYKDLSLEEIYTSDGKLIYNDDILEKLHSGYYSAPEKALELDYNIY